MNVALLIAILVWTGTASRVVVPDIDVDARDYLSASVSFSSARLSEGDTLIVTAVARNVSEVDIPWRPALVVGRRDPV